MLSSLPTLLSRIESREIRRCGVIPWGCPVPVFGNLKRSKIATLGINPSNLEFVDHGGNELTGEARRFHTLNSLQLPNWGSADASHVRYILDSFDEYFNRNPYDRWFKKFDVILASAGATYYEKREPKLPFFDTKTLACHLDLVPYATRLKWTELRSHQRDALLRFGGNCLGHLLRDSQIEFVICNGRSVVGQFEFVAGTELLSSEHKASALPRRSLPNVKGYVYEGRVSRMCGVDLGREISVLGFNHNLQSSFGVTSVAIRAISEWIAGRILEDEK